jgi:hypothetical protein
MSPRRLLWALLALALVWGPIALQNGAAMAAAPADHHQQMMEEGNCHEGKSDPVGHSSSKACCSAMCTALAVLPAPAGERLPIVRGATASVLADTGPSYLAELPTPPPRHS